MPFTQLWELRWLLISTLKGCLKSMSSMIRSNCVKVLSWKCNIFDHMCGWSRLMNDDQYFVFGFGFGTVVGFCWWVQLFGFEFMYVFGSVVISMIMLWGFVDECKAAWPARQCVSVKDSEIDIEVWWTSYLFIQVILWWSVCCHRTTGVSCGYINQEGHLSETCHHMTVVWTCSVAKLPTCHIDMETCC